MAHIEPYASMINDIFHASIDPTVYVMLKEKGADKVKVSYKYDEQKLISITSINSSKFLALHDYDKNGNIIRTVWRNGKECRVIYYKYNSFNLPIYCCCKHGLNEEDEVFFEAWMEYNNDLLEVSYEAYYHLDDDIRFFYKRGTEYGDNEMTISDTHGMCKTYKYDENGTIIYEEDPDEIKEYDDNHNVIHLSNSKVYSRFKYDEKGNVLKSIEFFKKDNSYIISKFKYDKDGNMTYMELVKDVI